MSKFKTMFSPRKMIVWVLAILIVLNFGNATMPFQSQTRAIVVMLGLDMVEDDNVNLTVCVLTPSSSTNNTKNVYSAIAPTMSEAVDKISLELGKDLGFAQCDVMAVGENISQKGVNLALDYFTRTKRVGRNALLINFEGDVKDFITSVAYLSDNEAIKLPQVVEVGSKYQLSLDDTIQKFYIGFYGDSGISTMQKFKVSKEPLDRGVEADVSQSPGNSGGEENSSGESSGGSGAGESKSLYFINTGETSIYQKGIKVKTLSSDMVKNVKLLNKESKLETYVLKDVNDEMYNNATVVLDMEQKDVKTKVSFDGITPKVKISLDLYVKVDEVKELTSKNVKARKDEYLNDTVVKDLQNKIQNQLEDAIQFMKTNNLDLIQVGDKFNKYQNKKWKKYKESLENSNYLEKIEFEFNVEVSQAH